MDELFQLLRIPSVSACSEHDADTARAVEWIAESMRTAGLQATVHPTADTRSSESGAARRGSRRC